MKAFINACETGKPFFTWFVFFLRSNVWSFQMARSCWVLSQSKKRAKKQKKNNVWSFQKRRSWWVCRLSRSWWPPLPGGFARLSLPIQQPHCTPTVIGCETFKLNLCGFLWTFLWAEMCEISGKIYPQHKTCSIQSKIWEISIVQNLSRNQFIFWARDGQDSWLKNHCSKMSLTYIKGMKIRVSKLVRCKMPVCAKLALNTRSANVLFMLIGMTE